MRSLAGRARTVRLLLAAMVVAVTAAGTGALAGTGADYDGNEAPPSDGETAGDQVPAAEPAVRGSDFAADVATVTLLGGMVACALAAWPPRRRVPGDETTWAGVAEPEADRASLIEAVIGVRDVVPSVALAARLDEALNEVGVVADEPVGQRFDSTAHLAVGTVRTDDSGLDGCIAEVSRAGYLDGTSGRAIRSPEVTVYKAAMEP
ncbi:hypothetical protein BH20ACT4_BH20ACT4_04090 [soil metagenome]